MARLMLAKSDLVLPKRRPDSHKGENGKVLVIAGSREYTGAALLAGLAAFRTGADIVTVAAPEKVAWALNCLSPDLITVKVRGERFHERHAEAMARLAGQHDVTLLGNGLSRHPSTMAFVRELLSSSPDARTWVLDADALKAIGGKDVRVRNAILTPHRGELEAMLGNAGISLSLTGKPEKDARLLQASLASLLKGGNVLLVKGRVDLIVSEKRLSLNSTGNAGMTVGGTGDVLAGICAGFASQLPSLFDAACASAYVNGALGDALYKAMGYGYLASDLVELLPFYLATLSRRR